MAGHSKWKNNLGRKTAQDAKKSSNFGKLSKSISVAIIEGGSPDPAFNARLRVAIEKAREASMPKDNIERAIAKGAGAGKDSLKSLLYELFGPGGIQLLVTATSDNPNRTNGEIQSLVHKYGAKLGGVGSVRHLFTHCATMEVQLPGSEDHTQEESALNIAEALQAHDMDNEKGIARFFFPFEQMGHAGDIAKNNQCIILDQPQPVYVPTLTIPISDTIATQLDTLIAALEDHDDVQEVFHNAVAQQDA